MFLPPVTRIVSPFTYEKYGLATPRIALAASSGLAGRRSGMSGNVLVSGWSLLASLPFLAAICLPGIPRATFVPSGVVMKAPASLAAVRRVVT